eukprot:CAMPEP_0179152020 /NCGR_PEP_ID=MMETSP0796-20121207/73853_1 /TAXON_ID=73915 /ORGANISM="Pyrodinium bahamense, Strain pbaha01" /LENGTH=51 /DNA_ID=CAMNT_0020853195 /DNA_START=20 /DNA_END=172 /DNA_ORIENTATION=-
MEVCDASPEYIQMNKWEWIQSPGKWCPWSVTGVVSVEDRRGQYMLTASGLP